MSTPSDTARIPPSPVVRHLRRLWWLWLVLLIAGAAGAAWWLLLPRSLHVAGRYPMASQCFDTTDDGFYLHESGARFTFRNWRGRLRYRFDVPEPQLALHSAVDPWERGFWETATRYTGYFASLSAAPGGVRYQLRRRGILLAETRVPGLKSLDPRVMLMEDGRALIWSADTQRTQPLWLYDGARLAAKGTLPARGLLIDYGKAMIAPAPNGSFAYYRLAVQGAQLVWSLRYTGTDPLTIEQNGPYGLHASVFEQGYVLADNGAIYNANGRRTGARPWRHEICTGGFTYTMEAKDGHWQVFSPITRDAWGFNPRGDCDFGHVSRDGRFAITFLWPDAQQRFYRLLTDRIPRGGTVAEDRLNRNFIAIYERPGRLRVLQRLNIEQWWGHKTPTDDDFWYNNAANGRALLVMITGLRPGGSGKMHQMTLLRW